MPVIKIHENILQFLLKKKIFFAPRKINTRSRLEQKLWFLGNSDYMCITFWNGQDLDRKVPNIYLEIWYENTNNVKLVLTSRRDTSKLPILNEVVDNLNLTKAKRKNTWTKKYEIKNNSLDEYFRVINEFIISDKIVIDKYVSQHKHPKLKHILSDEFYGYINRINKYRSEENSILFNGHRKIKAKKRIGVSSKNEDEQIRKNLKKIIKVKQEHSRLQNRLASQLKKHGDNLNVVLEENFVDLVCELDDEIHIYEVKTASTATKCIREGLGQLLSYYFLNFKESDRKIKLFIAGSAIVREEDFNFVEFIQNSIDVNFNYLQIC